MNDTNSKAAATNQIIPNQQQLDLIEKEKSSSTKKLKSDRLLAGLFFTCITTLGLLSGFGLSLIQTKKEDTKNFNKGLSIDAQEGLYESGVSLARRALLRATVYSVTGFSLFWICVWQISGAKNLEEFKLKAGSVLPRIKRKDNQVSPRTEFTNLTELFQYVIDEDLRIKAEKKEKKAAELLAATTNTPNTTKKE